VCCAIIPLIMIVTYGIMFITDLMIPMRVSEEVRRASCVAWLCGVDACSGGRDCVCIQAPPIHRC
jgi:hypothetical protein